MKTAKEIAESALPKITTRTEYERNREVNRKALQLKIERYARSETARVLAEIGDTLERNYGESAKALATTLRAYPID